MGDISIDLLNLYKSLKTNPSAGTKITLTEKISSLCQKFEMLDTEKEIISDILTKLAEDSVDIVRESVSSRFKSSTLLPRTVAKKLMSEIDSIAFPLISFSPVIEDEDLVELIKLRNEENCLSAIIKRESLGGELVGTLVDNIKSDKNAISLLKHECADMNTADMEKIADNFSNNESVALNMVKLKKDALSNKIKTKLMLCVSESMKQQLAEHGLGDPAAIAIFDEFIKDTKEINIFKNLQTCSNKREELMLVAALYERKAINENTLGLALCFGYQDFFLFSFAALTKSQVIDIEEAMSDKKIFTHLYISAGLEPSLKSSILAMYEIVKNSRSLNYKQTMDLMFEEYKKGKIPKLGKFTNIK